MCLFLEEKTLTRVPVSLAFASVQFNSTRQGKEGQSPRKLSLPREGKLVGQDHGELARRLFSPFLSLERPRSRLIELIWADESLVCPEMEHL